LDSIEEEDEEEYEKNNIFFSKTKENDHIEKLKTNQY